MRLDLSIDEAVGIYPRIIRESAENILQMSQDIMNECTSMLDICQGMANNMQTENVDVAMQRIFRISDMLQQTVTSMVDLELSVQDLTEKLIRLEQLANGNYWRY